MKKEKFLVCVLFGVFATLAFASGTQDIESKEKVPTLIIASSNAPDSLMAKMGERLQANINNSGVLRAKYLTGQSLGDMQQVMEQHMQGTVDIAFDRPLWFAPFVSDFQVLSWGFTFRDRGHLEQFYSSSIYEGMKEKVQEKLGITILYSAPDQARVTFSRKPIENADDVIGIKMRVPRIETFIELWETLGAKPTQVAWSEAFTSLKTGVVDAAESDIAGAWSQRFHQAGKYIALTNHVMMGIFVSINSEKLSSLNDIQKSALQDAVIEAVQWASSTSSNSVNETLEKMEADGAIINEIDVSPFQEKSRQGVQDMEARGVWPKGLWQQIQDIY